MILYQSRAAPLSATVRQRVGRSPGAPQRSGTSPELAPDARYWILSNAEDGLKFWVIGMVSFIVFSLAFEVPTYAILRANELKCPWYAIQTTLQANHMSLANTSTTGTVTQRSITP